MVTSHTGLLIFVVRRHLDADSSTTLRASVQYRQNKPFEVFSFRVMKAYRMVEGMPQAAQDADFAARVDGRAEHNFLEEIRGKMLGAGEGQKQTAGGEIPKRVEIEKLVATRGGVDVAAFVRQGGGVEDNDVE
jgi:hypothetical protein